jgi:hypothetical protein
MRQHLEFSLPTPDLTSSHTLHGPGLRRARRQPEVGDRAHSSKGGRGEQDHADGQWRRQGQQRNPLQECQLHLLPAAALTVQAGCNRELKAS